MYVVEGHTKFKYAEKIPLQCCLPVTMSPCHWQPAPALCARMALSPPFCRRQKGSAQGQGGEAHALHPGPELTSCALVGLMTPQFLKHAPQHPSFDDVCHYLTYPTIRKSFPKSCVSPTSCSVTPITKAAHGDTTGDKARAFV